MVERYDKLVAKDEGYALKNKYKFSPYEIGRILVRCIEDDRLDREREAAERRAERAVLIASRGDGITYNAREFP